MTWRSCSTPAEFCHKHACFPDSPDSAVFSNSSSNEGHPLDLKAQASYHRDIAEFSGASRQSSTAPFWPYRGGGAWCCRSDVGVMIDLVSTLGAEWKMAHAACKPRSTTSPQVVFSDCMVVAQLPVMICFVTSPPLVARVAGILGSAALSWSACWKNRERARAH